MASMLAHVMSRELAQHSGLKLADSAHTTDMHMLMPLVLLACFDCVLFEHVSK